MRIAIAIICVLLLATSAGADQLGETSGGASTQGIDANWSVCDGLYIATEDGTVDSLCFLSNSAGNSTIKIGLYQYSAGTVSMVDTTASVSTGGYVWNQTAVVIGASFSEGDTLCVWARGNSDVAIYGYYDAGSADIDSMFYRADDSYAAQWPASHPFTAAGNWRSYREGSAYIVYTASGGGTAIKGRRRVLTLGGRQ